MAWPCEEKFCVTEDHLPSKLDENPPKRKNGMVHTYEMLCLIADDANPLFDVKPDNDREERRGLCNGMYEEEMKAKEKEFKLAVISKEEPRRKNAAFGPCSIM